MLLKDDPFLLFVKYFELDPEKAEEWRSILEKNWALEVVNRCDPWLTPDEGLAVFKLYEQGESWEDFLRTRVFNYEKIRNEQRILEVAELLTKLDADKESDIQDSVCGSLMLISAHSEYYGSDPNTTDLPVSKELQADPTEYENILDEIRRNWELNSLEERLMNVTGAAVFPAFVQLVQLDQDEDFCARIGKEADTAAAANWIASIIRCWFSDLRKGRRTNRAASAYLNTLTNLDLVFRESPQVLLAMTALSVFWSRLKEQLDPVVISRLKDLSVSTDNLVDMVGEVRNQLESKTVSAAVVVSEIKNELCLVHKALLTEFES